MNSSPDKLVDCDGLKDRILHSTFLLSILFVSDVNFLLGKSSKQVQISSN